MTGLYRTDTEALDDCLRLMFPDQEPDRFRTDGGNINVPRIRSMWNERRDMRLMLQLSERFGVCVGKNMHGVAYVGRPGSNAEVILTYEEGSGPTAATAELLAVIRAIEKVGGSAGNAGVQPCRAEQRGPNEWACDCGAPRPDCKPIAGVKVDGGGNGL
jgi:hypothetical protein